MDKLLRTCLYETGKLAIEFKFEAVKLLQRFGEDAGSDIVAQVLINNQLGILEVVSNLLMTDQDIKI